MQPPKGRFLALGLPQAWKTARRPSLATASLQTEAVLYILAADLREMQKMMAICVGIWWFWSIRSAGSSRGSALKNRWISRHDMGIIFGLGIHQASPSLRQHPPMPSSARYMEAMIDLEIRRCGWRLKRPDDTPVTAGDHFSQVPNN